MAPAREEKRPLRHPAKRALSFVQSARRVAAKGVNFAGIMFSVREE
jgi:hypothetical protein